MWLAVRKVLRDNEALTAVPDKFPSSELLIEVSDNYKVPEIDAYLGKFYSVGILGIDMTFVV